MSALGGVIVGELGAQPRGVDAHDVVNRRVERIAAIEDFDAEHALVALLGDAALRGGQKYFRVHLFPFRMTAERLEREKDNPWHSFWLQLKEGYDHFEQEKTPPEVSVELGRYRFK